jgi:hypothetical protein
MSGKAWLVDTHVHLHTCFDVPAFFDAAEVNLRRAAERAKVDAAIIGCLMLTEPLGVDRFDELRGAIGDALGRWTITATQEPTSLMVRRGGGMPLVVVTGRQIVTDEGLEVLALGSGYAFEDGQPIERTIEQVKAAEAVCVLPWGVGKWWGGRGAVVRRLIEGPRQDRFMLADNGNRLMSSPIPALLRLGEAEGMCVLAGSDPLPLLSHQKRVGIYGVVLNAPIGLQTPAADLRRALAELGHSPPRFGWLSRPGDFLVSQAAMQIRRRFRHEVRSTP